MCCRMQIILLSLCTSGPQLVSLEASIGGSVAEGAASSVRGADIVAGPLTMIQGFGSRAACGVGIRVARLVMLMFGEDGSSTDGLLTPACTEVSVAATPGGREPAGIPREASVLQAAMCRWSRSRHEELEAEFSRFTPNQSCTLAHKHYTKSSTLKPPKA